MIGNATSWLFRVLSRDRRCHHLDALRQHNVIFSITIDHVQPRVPNIRMNLANMSIIVT